MVETEKEKKRDGETGEKAVRQTLIKSYKDQTEQILGVLELQL